MKHGCEKQGREHTAQPGPEVTEYLLHQTNTIRYFHASGHVKDEDDVLGAVGGGQIPRPGQ